ncbi:bifunctional diaminohydroxyphosphoribosylaminopyrimidine deaminase/5-amino-6-(5-phosphoribosylamino)uracil reductase RibD [Daejeonella sp. JGW-45]|uniref:bifunctional diaminohydroxyphosphoribosylaminopyrimidine deaminase/5-amino-6-(5-phosphoribosylamino)uracil reductase RibD n=1 Tax=Daejeonella sp. JGW-45 TaxID=3034148 RepID=UPI0023EC7646|nr:bifunctional diaminohydroxyphosphoribosylaminopyrimidine deaminase/5-amino-6-(5-phosphoribosylamino)uracil reductase RibD [Daejeonella sp. JGW-45]
MQQHEGYMRRCLELACLGMGSVSPNPMVGAVIVCDDRIIGEGYHKAFGEAHAEVNALRSVLDTHANGHELLKRSTIYVSLEPCVHFGKTPPCTDLIINNNIPRVVVGCSDPYGQVNGKGIEKLRDAGVEVVIGVLEHECLLLNKRFDTRIKQQRPYIILKWARTRDGFFAPADLSQKWITARSAKQLVHKWRSEEDAVLVGSNTVRADNPRLNVREWSGKSPVRIVVDRNLELAKNLHIFDQSQDTIIFNALKTELDGRIKYLELEDFGNLLPQLICYQLYLMDVQSVIIEGGATILGLFISAGLWDEARVFTGTGEWTRGIKSPSLPGSPLETLNIGPDILTIWRNNL